MGKDDWGDFMKEITLILRFVVIWLIYAILFNFIRVMLKDLKAYRAGFASFDYALEVVEAPDLSGVAVGTIFPVRDETSIGRKEDNEISINDPFLSSRHAVITMGGDRLYIRDLNSTNGTKVNDEFITGETELGNGDTLEVGRIIFKIIG